MLTCSNWLLRHLKRVEKRMVTMGRFEERYFEWNPVKSFFGPSDENQYIMIILNRPIRLKKAKIVFAIWKRATFRVTVDGGTNRWLKWLKENQLDKERTTAPDLICGDMDSIKRESIQHFLEKNPYVQILKYEDSLENDFTQSLVELQQYLAVTYWNIKSVVVICETSGRFDHILSNFHTLFKAKAIIPSVNVYMYSNTSLSWLLTEGSHKLHIPDSLLINKDWCSLMPLGNPCLVSTQGLETNFNNTYMAYGQRISSSNSYKERIVTIKTSDTIVWSMGMINFDYEKKLEVN